MMTPRGQNCARRAQSRFSALCPLAPTPFDRISPNLVQGCSITRSFKIVKFRGVQKLGGSKFGKFHFYEKNNMSWTNFSKGRSQRPKTCRIDAPWYGGCAMQVMTPRGQNCARRAQSRFSALCPLAQTPLDLGTPNLVQGCRVTRSFKIMKFRGVQNLGGSKF